MTLLACFSFVSWTFGASLESPSHQSILNPVSCVSTQCQVSCMFFFIASGLIFKYSVCLSWREVAVYHHSWLVGIHLYLTSFSACRKNHCVIMKSIILERLSVISPAHVFILLFKPRCLCTSKVCLPPWNLLCIWTLFSGPANATILVLHSGQVPWDQEGNEDVVYRAKIHG